MKKIKLLTRRSLLVAAPAVLLVRPTLAQVGQIATWPPKAVVVGGGPSSLLTGIAGYWKFDENTGTSVADASGNSNTLTIVGTSPWTTGKINSGFVPSSFSVDLHAHTGDQSSGSLDFAGAVTMSTWLYYASGSMNYGPMIVRSTAGDVRSFGMYVFSATFLYITLNNTANPGLVELDTGIATDVWTHVAVVADGTNTVTAYLNGAAHGTFTATGDAKAATGTQDTMIGAAPGQIGSLYFSAGSKLDEAAVWSRALTPTEIATLYNAGSGLQYPF